MEKFPLKMCAITLRGSISASENTWAGMLYDGTAFFSKTYHINNIVDRVGGGDSFGGALIYSLLGGYDKQEAIDFAAAASCLKHSIEHDYNLVSVDEVRALASGSGSGRVQR
jgi:2-dehydro-3-deoxygluconokinase